MSAPDAFALGGYQQDGDHPLVLTCAIPLPFADLWEERRSIDGALSLILEPGDEEDRLVERLRAIEDEIAGNVAIRPVDLIVQLQLLQTHLQDCELSDFAKGIIGKMFVGLLTLHMGGGEPD